MPARGQCTVLGKDPRELDSTAALIATSYGALSKSLVLNEIEVTY